MGCFLPGKAPETRDTKGFFFAGCCMTEGGRECIPQTMKATMVVGGPGGAVWKGREESKGKNSFFPPPGFPRQLKRNERQERERGEEGRTKGPFFYIRKRRKTTAVLLYYSVEKE